MPVSPNTEKTTTAAAPSLSELHVSYFGDEIALNLLPALAVKRLSNRGQPIALTERAVWVGQRLRTPPPLARLDGTRFSFQPGDTVDPRCTRVETRSAG